MYNVDCRWMHSIGFINFQLNFFPVIIVIHRIENCMWNCYKTIFVFIAHSIDSVLLLLYVSFVFLCFSLYTGSIVYWLFSFMKFMWNLCSDLVRISYKCHEITFKSFLLPFYIMTLLCIHFFCDYDLRPHTLNSQQKISIK